MLLPQTRSGLHVRWEDRTYIYMHDFFLSWNMDKGISIQSIQTTVDKYLFQTVRWIFGASIPKRFAFIQWFSAILLNTSPMNLYKLMSILIQRLVYDIFPFFSIYVFIILFPTIYFKPIVEGVESSKVPKKAQVMFFVTRQIISRIHLYVIKTDQLPSHLQMQSKFRGGSKNSCQWV